MRSIQRGSGGCLWTTAITLISLFIGLQVRAQYVGGQLRPELKDLKPLGTLAPTNEIFFVIALPLRNQDVLNQLLRDLYDPASPQYHRYVSSAEFAERFGPTETQYQSLMQFARARGLNVAGTHPNRTLLDVSGAAADVEQALNVSLQMYQHPTEKRMFYAPDRKPTLDVAIPVLGISGLDNYSRPTPRLQADSLEAKTDPVAYVGTGHGGAYQGKDFRAAYAPGVTLTGVGEMVGLLEFDGYSAGDITYYETKAGISPVRLINVLLDGFDGAPSGSRGEHEVCLDIEMAISMAPGLAGVMVYTAGPDGHFYDIMNRMATDNLARQLACCWGGSPDASSPISDQIFLQMAAQGQSFFAACGDGGALTGPVNFPSDNPYVTLVGGTSLVTSGPGKGWLSEEVWNGTGGGVSTHYLIPDYQTNISMAVNQGSTTMRNIPDVAMVADNVFLHTQGKDYIAHGTSCAAPLWAGFAALANQEAVSHGAPIGFINPALSRIGSLPAYASCFHDVTMGNNTSGESPNQFYAAAGYDLCTGWGTPSGQKLIDALAIPDPLLVAPAYRLSFTGGAGGAFAPKKATLILTNAGTSPLSWELVNTSAWFSVSPAQGTLSGRTRATNITVIVNEAATHLAVGTYAATLVFSNLTSGAAQTRSLTLGVGAAGMADDFESGLDLTQWAGFGDTPGISVMATNYGGSISGSNSLWFGRGWTRYATTIPINTSSGGQIAFGIRLADGDGYPWEIVDQLPEEGVVLEYSVNGGHSWTAIRSYDSAANYAWTGTVLSVPSGAKSGATQFRWRQLRTSGTNSANWALDNVVIGNNQSVPQIIYGPQDQFVMAGSSPSLQAAVTGASLRYQWRLNGKNIKGANSNPLVIKNVQPTNAGTYSLLCSNPHGSVASSNAVLGVSPVAPGLVSWWRGEGNCNDEKGLVNGKLVNGAAFITGKIGQAFLFNGEQQCVALPYTKKLTAPKFSVGAWVEPRAQVSNDLNQDLIVGQSTGWYLVARPGNSGLTIGFGFATSGVSFHEISSASEIPIGQFSHVMGTWDGITLRLYINGILDASVSPGVSPVDPRSNFYIGGFYIQSLGQVNYSDQFLKGAVDEVVYFNRALTDGEVRSLGGGSVSPSQRSPSMAAAVWPSGPVLEIDALDGGVFRIRCSGMPEGKYRLQRTENPAASSWDDLGILTADQSGSCEYLDHPRTNSPAHFYRATSP